MSRFLLFLLLSLPPPSRCYSIHFIYFIYSVSLSPSTTYFWQVIVRSFDNPSVNFMQSYQSLTEESGWGISTFITPASLPPLRSPPTARTITNTRQVTNANKVYTYATLDNVSPTATKVSCSNTPRKVPSGWTFAPNSNVTRTSIHPSLPLPAPSPPSLFFLFDYLKMLDN